MRYRLSMYWTGPHPDQIKVRYFHGSIGAVGPPCYGLGGPIYSADILSISNILSMSIVTPDSSQNINPQDLDLQRSMFGEYVRIACGLALCPLVRGNEVPDPTDGDSFVFAILV